MTMEYEWTVEGVELSDYFYVLRDTLYRPNHEINRTIIEVAGRHGSVNPHPYPIYKEATASFTLGFFEHDSRRPTLAGRTISDMDRLLNRLFGAGPVTLTRSYNGITDTATADVTVPPTLSTDYGVDGAKWVTSLTLTTPFFHNTTPITLAIPTSGGAIAELKTFDAPIADLTILRFQLPSTDVTLGATDVASGTGVLWTGIKGSHSYLYIDASNAAAWLADSDDVWVASQGVDDTAHLSWPAAGLLQMYPKVDYNSPMDSAYALKTVPATLPTGAALTMRTYGARF